MSEAEKSWIWIIPITAIVICGMVLIFLFIDFTAITCPADGQGRNMSLIYSILIVIIAILVIVFPLTYYYISHSLKREFEKNIQIISQITNKNEEQKQKAEASVVKPCKSFILKFLDYNENRVIKKLIEGDGSALQSEISRLPNMGKVKAHRVLKDMEIKGIIVLERYGKTNKISFSEDAKEVFIK